MKRTVEIDDVKEGMICNQTICDDRGIILVSRGLMLNTPTIQGLRKFGVKSIVIKEGDDEREESEKRSSVLNQKFDANAGINICKNLASAVDEYNTVNVAKYSAQIEHVVAAVMEKPFLQEILQEIAQNEVLYHHSLRTTILALSMGLTKEYNLMNLEYLTMCALLHDCGMGGEYHEENTDHCLLGFTKLRQNMKLDMIVALVCLQHHEQYDGNGYPLKFGRRHITEFAGLLSVADYYDRLIMKKDSPRHAVFKVAAGKNSLFEPEMVSLFEASLRWE